MLQRYCLLAFLLCTSALLHAQQNINEVINNGFHPEPVPRSIPETRSDVHVFPVLDMMEQLKTGNNPTSLRQGNEQLLSLDTLIVGLVPNDTLIITGNWTHTGPIWVLGTGVLIFDNATVIDTGDVYVFQTGKLFADSSSFFFPQTYFYERSLLVVQDGYAKFTDCSFNYSGMSHNLVVAHNAEVEMINIHQNDWTTCGLSGSPTFSLRNCNLSGEYILNDTAAATFELADSIILWHQFPGGSLINYSFPPGDTVNGYQFDNTVPGVSGVSYSASVDSCHTVWWAIMPENNTDVTISNSDLRLIGCWFRHSDTAYAAGIFNNTVYASYTTPLNDRTLQLNTTSVGTWSFYVFDASFVEIDSCQLGEVGAQQFASVYGHDFVLDGSGGYFWGTDSTFIVAQSVISLSTTRAERNSTFVLAYSWLPYTAPTAIANGTLIAAQNLLVADPVPYDASVAWLGYIAGPDTSYTNATIGIFGSAWIDQGPLGNPVDFVNYSLAWQNPFVSQTWYPIVTDSVQEIRNNNALGVWSTMGFTPGTYVLRLTIESNTGDTIDCLRIITLLPGTLGVNENEFSICSVYPNPAKDVLYVNAIGGGMLNIYSADGKLMHSATITATSSHVDLNILASGLYFWTFSGANGETGSGNFMKE
jgi:hypothetical protein